ncbi:MAG: cation transporter [Planctomycetota bacterium]|nr:MAG: cation transporter [Planctomycetota bacterium]
MEHLGLWLKFATASAIVIGAGLSLTKNAERLAVAMGWGHAFAGFVVLGWATSLPEVTISVSAVTSLDSPALAAGNITGSVIFNLAILALLDLLADPMAGRDRSGAQGLAPLAIFNLVLMTGLLALLLSSGLREALSPLTAGCFLLGGYLAATVHAWWSQRGESESGEAVERGEAGAAAWRCLVAGGVILGAGIWLSHLGDAVAEAYQLDEGLIGTLFLGGVSSLPELVTGLAAVRLGLISLAVGSILGSNVFNLGILGVCELLYVNAGADRPPLIVAASDPRMAANLGASLALTVLALWLVRARSSGAKRSFLATLSSVMLLIYVSVLAFS